jgi:hypothetical protein
MADPKSIRKPSYSPPAGYVTEDQLRAETGISQFTLKRLREDGLVPWRRENCQSGRFTIYPESAIGIVRCILALPEKGFDNRFFTLWLKGYDDVNMVSWIDRGLSTTSKKLARAKPDALVKVIAEAIGKARMTGKGNGNLRGKPQQAIFGRMRVQDVRRSAFKWGLDIAGGAIPETSPTVAKAFGGVPDPQLNLSLDQLRAVNNGASVAEREQVRKDCGRLSNAIRSLTGPVRTGEKAYTAMIGLWDKQDFRAVLIPSLIHMRRQNYDGVDGFLIDFETELHAHAIEQFDKRRENYERPATMA